MTKTAAQIARELRAAALSPEPPPVERIELLNLAAILDPPPRRRAAA